MKRSQFIKNYGVYFSGAIIVAFFNYLFYPVLARVMSLADFGELQVLVSLFAEFAVITSAVSVAVLHIVAAPGDTREKARTITELRKLVRIGALGLSVALALLSFWLHSFFHFASPLPFLALAALVFASTLPLFGNAYLQGKLQYFKTSVSSLIAAVARIVGASAMVVLGYGVAGAVLGIAGAQILVWMYVTYQSKNSEELNLAPAADIDALGKPNVARELRYAALVLVTNVCITILYTIDVLLVKHYFDPGTAGLYAGISAVAKIGYFALVPLATVILPSVAGDVPGRHHSLRTALAVFFALAIPGIVTSYLFRGLIVSVLFGARYVPLSGLLPLATLLMVAVGLAQLFSSYFLALRKAALMFVMPFSLAVGLMSVALFHGSIANILEDLLFGTATAIAGLIIIYAKDHLRSHTDL